MLRMCETRRGVLTVPNGPNNISRALAAAERQARASVGDSEELASGSVRLDGSGSPRLDDETVMEFHYVYVVRVPGCTGWGMPLT